MSIQIMAAVWDSPCTDPQTLLLLLALADWSNDAGECWPSIPRLAAKTRQSERNCRLHLRRLESLGILDRLEGRGRSHPNHYFINLQSLQSMQQSLPPLQVSRQKETLQHGDQNPATSSINTAPSFLSPSDSPSYISPVPEPSLEPSLRAREAPVKKAAAPRKQKTPFPATTPEAQARLKTSILDPAFDTWYASTGLQDVLMYPDLAWQWEQFALDAQANGRVYASWRQAFMKWLGSKYQERKTAHGPSSVNLLAWAKEQDRPEQEGNHL